MAGEWYLGPAGDLRALECPERDVSVSEVRFGGVHQGLSGARTVDVTGLKMQINLALNYLDETQYLWLEAIHLRHIPGPVYVINPLKRNLLSKESSMSRTSYFQGNGIYASATGYSHNWEWEYNWPTAAGPGTRVVKRTGLLASSVVYQLDVSPKIPVTVGSSYTFSSYMKGDSSKTVVFGISWYQKDGTFISTSTSSKSVTTSWARHQMTATAPANAALAVPRWESTTNVSFSSTAVQFEQASSATDWQLGGGSMRVMIDQMPTTSPRFPLRNCSLTLLEA